ncbi:MAG TPA: DUF4262 domain-containing protein [Arthrobacter sp.]|nr:DUF4262 domain-containing protein [Arthrobacter sp.]
MAETKLAIARHGWSVAMVKGTLTAPGYGYTIGFTEQRHPELLITGGTPEETADALSMLAGMVLVHGHQLTPGNTFELPGGEIYLAAIEQPRNILWMAAKLYSWRMKALQVVWTDDDGRFPWERNPPGDLTQPLYGTPPVSWPAERVSS